MERYEVYKDSGVEWIGEIPAGWELRRISALYDARNEKVSDQDYPPLSVTMQGIVPQLETAAKTQDGDNRKLVKAGDFVINSRSDRRGACGISDYDGSVTLISNVLAPKERYKMNARYYSYLFRSDGFADEFYRQGTGIVDDLWSTNWSRMKNILVARPSLSEQEAIADYLDDRTAEINALVANCEQEVELLQEYRKAVISEAVTKGLDSDAPMKDSGVEWIGEIPMEWEIMQLGRLCRRIFDGPFGSNLKSNDYVDEGVRVVRLENLKYLQFDETKESFVTPEKYETISQHTVYPEDLIVATFIIDSVKACRLPGNIGFAVNKADCLGVRTGEAIDVDFLKYYLSSSQVYDYLSRLTHGSTRQRINTTQLKALLTLLPPMSVQQDIVAHLDAKTAEIDALIDAKQKMADRLREYHKSLISEAVTGKFKVPNH
jgi:type I restriction enzyme S subunit